jgi:hypothetical protein
MRYTTSQVQKIINVSKPTLYKLCKQKCVIPQKTSGGHSRYSDQDIKKLLGENGLNKNIDQKFVETVNDVWFILKKLSEDIWGIGKGEQKLIDIIQKNRNDIFILNLSVFKEK